MASNKTHQIEGTCITIGNFDGVHLGHQSLINAGLEISHKKGLDFAALTFWPHPRTVLNCNFTHLPLSTRQERRNLLAGCGVSHFIEMPFTQALAAMNPETFIGRYLLPLHLRHLVVGHDFSLGHNREGDIDTLRQIAADMGFEVTRIPALDINGATVSSTRLRQAIKNGDVLTASRLLGRYYTVCGSIAHGYARGRTLGYPTANLEPYAMLIPGEGVYATFAGVDGQRVAAITNIGANPTFEGKKITIETFLLDTSMDLYGKEMCLEFVARLRSERKFPGADALVAQIGEDIRQAKHILEVESPWRRH